MLKTNGKIHHAWFILLVCLGIMGGLVGILLNCTGIIFTEIIKEFGFRTGDLAIICLNNLNILGKPAILWLFASHVKPIVINPFKMI